MGAAGGMPCGTGVVYSLACSLLPTQYGSLGERNVCETARMLTLELTAIKRMILVGNLQRRGVTIGADRDPTEFPFCLVKLRSGASLARGQPSVPFHTLPPG